MNPELPQPTLAISVLPPWAWLVIAGFKDFLNRDWTANYGPRRQIQIEAPMRVCIHASNGKLRDHLACQDYVDIINIGRVAQDLAPIKLPSYDQLRKGGIVGVTTLARWTDEKDPTTPWSWGSGSPLLDSEPVPFIPCKGQIGLFTPTFSK